ncbi:MULTISPECIES: tyrosine-type recombinase/integrase [Paenibacillus]|uniref:tyrosine-type recombinase/integrase n=1 Tax=Paenibacillus TaxID=44249 RepID=UPI0022B89DBA|nr:tyrosine-type recombinase/integrase [Paenibacillus caseinilyticus]MCZ8520165.1 tyrosine-type recombinase/integrase [Paenibacillus caseinilyticus]
MARIRKRGKNSFLLIVELGYDAKGKRIQKTKTIKAKGPREAEKELARFVVEVESGEYIDPGKMSFGQFVQHWREKFVEQNLEETSIKNYLFHVNKRILPQFDNKRIDQIRTIEIQDFLYGLSKPGSRADGKLEGLGPSSLAYIYRVLQSIFSKAVEWKVIKENPMIGVTKPKETSKEMEVYSEEEVVELFEALQNEKIHLRTMISLALTTGLRRAEIIGLEWKHINLEKGTLEVRQSIPLMKNGQPVIKSPKTRSSIRNVSLPESVVEELREYQLFRKKERLKVYDKWEGDPDRSFVFAGWSGRPLNQKTPGDWWRDFHKRNPQLKFIRFHDLRHTSATLLINQGVHAKIISQRLGHSKIGTTMNVYGHVIESADRAAATKFDSLFYKRKPKTR